MKYIKNILNETVEKAMARTNDNSDFRNQGKKLSSSLSMDQKLQLLSGANFWQTHALPRQRMRAIRVSDGPHGLRKESGQAAGMAMAPSEPAVCYPTASALACSFDRELMYRIGTALAEECQEKDVQVLLGPGVNHKRSPLCGRNFEYFSEDPIVSSEMAIPMVKGLQDHGVGACIKHFAANSQEYGRMVSDSIVDKRALMELYLLQFERIIRRAQPWAVMTSYNKLNGTYSAENGWLMNETARDRWGFQGAFFSDWGGVSSSVASVKNGLNLEMPGGDNGTLEQLQDGILDGTLTPKEVFRASSRTAELIAKGNYYRDPSVRADLHAHLFLAQQAAEQSAVLLKNDKDLLPVQKDDSIALIGMMAKRPRYQGAGSSKVNSLAVDCLYDVINASALDFEYADGYSLDDELNKADSGLVKHACKIAKKKDKVIIVAGLPDSYESEGFDRTDLALPKAMNTLISKVAAVNPNVIVVLQAGSPVSMPWIRDVKSVLMMYLSGCQGGKAAFRLLTGQINPSGHLAETFPLKIKDTPCCAYFANDLLQAQYRESIYSGYRYYDTVQSEVLFPFGHGLSYTTFEYSKLRIETLPSVVPGNNNDIVICCDVKNTGKVVGSEVVQLYLGHTASRIPRAKKELKQFQKICLNPGEQAEVRFEITDADLQYYDTALDDWSVEAGDYRVSIGSSSRDIRLTGTFSAGGSTLPHSDMPEFYFKVENGIFTVDDSAFARLLGKAIPAKRKARPFTKDTSLQELKASPFGKLLLQVIQLKLRGNPDPMFAKSILGSPLRIVNMGPVKKQHLEAFIALMNHHPAQAVQKLTAMAKHQSLY